MRSTRRATMTGLITLAEAHMLTNVEIVLLTALRDALPESLWSFLMLAVSRLGDAGLLWIVISILLIVFSRTRRAGAASALALSLSFLVCNLTLKPWVERLRPCDISDSIEALIACPADFSFPSGHTSAAFAAAGAIAFFFPKWGTAALVFSVLTAVSRMYLFVHFPTDVFFGALLGLACAACAVLVVRRLTYSPNRK